MKKIGDGEKGSVTLIVSVTILFIFIALSSSLATVSAKRKSQLMESKKLQEIYSGDMHEIYDDLIEYNSKREEIISIGEAINAKNYGKKVTNYKTEETTVGCWRLFYQDKVYTYLISDNILNLGSPIEKLYK